MKVNIAHLIGTLGVGGAEQQVVSLVNQLSRDLFDKHVIVFRDVKDGFRNLLDKDVKSYSLQSRRRFTPTVILRLIKYLRKSKIDILHCHMHDPSKLGAITKKIALIPVIVTTDHGIPVKKSWYRHVVERVIINKTVCRRVAVSQQIQDFLIKRRGVRPENVITIPTGTIVPKYAADTKSTPRIVGAMGRLAKVKDYPTLFKAVKLVKEKGFDVELRIAGEGPEKDLLQKFIQGLNMSGYIKLLGLQKPHDFLKQTDIFVMSSIREGTPVALLEAMARGIPVVATKVGGIGNVIEDGKDGLLLPPQNPKALADNIIRLILNDQLRIRIGRNAREKIVHKYSMVSIATRYAELYKELLVKHERKLK
jgi:glycosyltransferase involved in cell wall biosynthesis